MMASQTETILTKLGTRLHTDATLLTFSSTRLGKNHNVYVGLDRDDQPKASLFPLIVIDDIKRVKRGSSQNIHEYQVVITVGVSETTIVKSGTPPNEKFLFDGFILAESFRDEAEKAIFRECINNQWKCETDGDTISDNTGFLWNSSSAIMISVKISRQSAFT